MKRSFRILALSLVTATASLAAEPTIVTHGADARASEVRYASLVGSIPHAREAVVRGDTLRMERAVVVVADEEGARDRDWGSALWRVDAAGVRRLAGGLYHASRPLASVDGFVYVERGASGPWPTRDEARAGRLRTDALAIDAVDPQSGASHTIATWTGYTMHLAGEIGAELVVYRVAHEGADLVAIDRASGRTRLVASVLPMARDFSIDEASHAIVFTNRDEVDSHLWVLDRIDLTTGARERLRTERDRRPRVARDGDVR